MSTRSDGNTGPSDDDAIEQQLRGELARRLAQASDDPFTNAYLLFALEVTGRLEREDVSLQQLSSLVDTLTFQAFVDRAERLGAYLGSCDPCTLTGHFTALFQRLASAGDFDTFAAAVARAPFGVVLTAHPTFSLRRDLSKILVELATGRDDAGLVLDEAAREARLAKARSTHAPPAELSLDVEHAWSIEALHNAHYAMGVVYGCALDVARERWPKRWTELAPTMLTLATWVGFDQDGRTDVSWQISFEKRLQLKLAALEMRSRSVAQLTAAATGAFKLALASLQDLMVTATDTVRRQLAELSAARSDPALTPSFARAMVGGRPTAMVDATPLLHRLDLALAAAPDDPARRELLILRASVLAEGVSLARIHVRLNAGQLHNAIRAQVGLETEPRDPTHQRTYFAAIDRMIGEVQPVQINFGDLMREPASARALMMSVAQMSKFVDASTPVRFLIAETETGFTLLTALYYARLFGVAGQVEISPLFETEEALERGERVIEEALRSPHYRAYLASQGRLAIEFGFSDSGRFIGQLAATFRIERLRLRLANLLQARGLTDLEVVFFNTHGESLGRGGHPGGLRDRFRYAAPPASRREFAARGIRLKEEDAFQGGEGYLPLLTPSAALATLFAGLASVLEDDPEDAEDPIYDDPDFASEFFATVQTSFSSLVHDPDYAALVGLFGTRLLPKSGSRPVQRQSAEGGPQKLEQISQLRAIPNNGVLQQLGYLANTLYGLGGAASKSFDTFQDLRSRSIRFRRALTLAQAAYDVSELPVLEAYVATVDPALWLDRATMASSPACDIEACEIAEQARLSEDLARATRRLKSEEILLRQVFTRSGGVRRDRLLLLHALRLALIQRICRLAVHIPAFNPVGASTRSAMLQRLMRLDVPDALEKLVEAFPIKSHADVGADFAEPSSYGSATLQTDHREHEMIFAPIKDLFQLALAISVAINHEVGAIG